MRCLERPALGRGQRDAQRRVPRGRRVQEKSIRDWLSNFDKDGDGRISKQEFRQRLSVGAWNDMFTHIFKRERFINPTPAAEAKLLEQQANGVTPAEALPQIKEMMDAASPPVVQGVWDAMEKAERDYEAMLQAKLLEAEKSQPALFAKAKEAARTTVAANAAAAEKELEKARRPAPLWQIL
mgnify:CR=1 FL=1